MAHSACSPGSAALRRCEIKCEEQRSWYYLYRNRVASALISPCVGCGSRLGLGRLFCCACPTLVSALARMSSALPANIRQHSQHGQHRPHGQMSVSMSALPRCQHPSVPAF
eukprot:1460896-Rhodomonas_salina.2